MLINFWYAIELSSAVALVPKKLKVLGQWLVLYRTEAGAVVVQSDRCPHRGGDLGDGKVIDGCLRCPYHGWRFDAHGACVSIPANAPGTPIPKRARIDSYPVEERYGLVWAFLGDLPPAERPPIPPFPEYGQPGWKMLSGEFLWKAHYARVVENGLDFAHGPFVHSASFGNINKPQIADYEVQKDDFSAAVSIKVAAQEQKGLWRYFGSRSRPDVPVGLSLHMPNINRIHLKPKPEWEIILFDSNVPVDEEHTRTLWISLRNFLPGNWADRNARTRVLRIFEEDRPIVEAQRPTYLGIETGDELPIKSDLLPTTFRRLRKKYHDLGWGLDRARGGQAERLVSLPSPARRDKELAKSFVIAEVPRVEAKQKPE